MQSPLFIVTRDREREREMERVTKLPLILIIVFLVAFATDVEGARIIKSNEKVDQPQNFFGGTGTIFPTPGFRGSFPSPGFSGSFPSPGIGGSFPSPGFGESFPSPGIGGSFPTPLSPTGFRFGPPAGSGSICSFFPGSAGCVPVRPTNSGGSVGGGSSPGGSP